MKQILDVADEFKNGHAVGLDGKLTSPVDVFSQGGYIETDDGKKLLVTPSKFKACRDSLAFVRRIRNGESPDLDAARRLEETLVSALNNV
jgi:hypothetical protein